ncbi:MAG TPA: DUF4417 domain-containing protein [Capsulimonadaceae bacterium]|jgi:hypothetical protein
MPADNSAFPIYATSLAHEYCRKKEVDLPFVVIPIESLFSMKSGKCKLPESTSSCLRSKFGLKPDAMVLVECVDQDCTVEGFWQNERSAGIIAQLANMALVGATVPNFSYFYNAPRTQTLYNRRRSTIIAERMSQAGLAPIIHLNALTPSDWKWWESVLSDNPSVNLVAKEFGTGLRTRSKGIDDLWRMECLQDRLGRSLHPVLFSARRYLKHAVDRFERLTIVDSHPFHLTRSRRKLTIVNGKPKVVVHKTQPGEPLDDLYAHNVAEYSRYFEAAFASTTIQEYAPISRPRQVEPFDLELT